MEKRKLRIPLDSKLPYAAAGCAAVMFLFEFCMMTFYLGLLRVQLIPGNWHLGANVYNGGIFYNLGVAVAILVPIVLIFLCCGPLKKNSALLLIPLGFYVFSRLLLFVAGKIDYFLADRNEGTVLLVVSLSVFVLALLTVCDVLKSGLPLGISCCAVCVCFLVATVFFRTLFADGTSVRLWELFQHIGFYGSLAILAFSLSRDPDKKYYEKPVPVGFPVPPYQPPAASIPNPAAPPAVPMYQQAVPQSAPVPAVSAPVPTPQKGVEERLNELQSLREKGLISEEEFEAKKKDILASL